MKLQRIQIMRFLAAAGVYALHAEGTLSAHLPSPNTLGILRKEIHVDFFFVMSGFIIHLTVRSRESDWLLFLKRRFWRLVPLYWMCTLALAVMLPIFAHGPPPPGTNLIRSLLFLQWTAGGEIKPVLWVGWTLEYEMFFYAVAIWALIAQAKPSRIICPLFSVLALVGVYAGVERATPGHGLFFFCNPMLLDFAFGILIGEGLARRRIPWFEFAPVALATVMVLQVSWGWRVWYVGLPSVAIILGTALLDARSPIRSRAGRAFARLGNASYSIYLTQPFTISPLVRLAVVASRWLPYELLVALVVAVGVASGWVFYLLVEAPLQRWVHKRSAVKAERAPSSNLAAAKS